MSLKNMTEEEKKARKRKQKNEAQKRYYQKNKVYYKNYSKQWSKENLLKKDKEIERLNNIKKEVRECVEKELSFNVVINGKENKVIGYNKAFDKILEILDKEVN